MIENCGTSSNLLLDPSFALFSRTENVTNLPKRTIKRGYIKDEIKVFVFYIQLFYSTCKMEESNMGDRVSTVKGEVPREFDVI